MFYLLLILGVIIRFLLIPIPGFKADVAFWKGWGLAIVDKGIVWLVNSTNYNYPPGFAYVLWFVNKIYALFKNPYNISEYWADNNLFYLFLLKLITIGADLLVVWVIIKIARELEVGSWMLEGKKISNLKPQTSNISKYAKIFALLYFFNSAVIYDGVVWGQVDQFGLALFLLSVYLILKDRPNWGAAIFTIATLMKFQNIIFIPLFYLFIFKRFSFNALVSSLSVTFITFIIVVLPFFLTHQMDRIIWLLTINSDWFPWYSLNAFNIWWLLSGLKGMQLVDKHLVFGITSAKQLGLYMFIFAYFISTVTVLFAKKENIFRNFILACTLVVFAFFHLLTQSHERYLFPVMGLFPLLIICRIISNFKAQMSNQSQNSNIKKEDRKSFGFWNLKLIWNLDFVIWILVSIFFFANMYLSMGWNYPDQVFPPFTRDQTVILSSWISVVQMILFVIFVIWYFKTVWVARDNRFVGAIAGFGMILILALLGKNMPYFLGKPISLTLLKPVSYHQDYLEPVYNKTVESARGVKFWNRLSVNYYFYDKGIGSHADSEITYHLARRFSKFSSDFGLDTEADQSAKVYFSLLGDGRELFKSDLKGRFDKPGTTNLDIKGVNYLTLKIVKATETNFGAHADWLNPLLIR